MITTLSLEQALFEGAKEVFETMVFMSIEKAAESAPFESECILGTITFTGPLLGCVAVCCSVDCAKSIAANMTGLDPGAQVSDPELNDAMGEIANMVMGSFKSRISETVGNVNVSIPSVVRGTHLATVLLEPQERIEIPVMIDEHCARLILLSKFKS